MFFFLIFCLWGTSAPHKHPSINARLSQLQARGETPWRMVSARTATGPRTARVRDSVSIDFEAEKSTGLMTLERA
jgi:hypothetical protein